ncbi:hypothetical protein CN083_15640 [Sinorhizobium meliloti]|nr:hypothetical protein CN083_15640 [Sinorhizobium meliloti]
MTLSRREALGSFSRLARGGGGQRPAAAEAANLAGTVTTMDYDWSGKRTRRMKALKLAVMTVLGTALAVFLWEAST